MTMQELKPIATAAFNGLVEDADAQQYFADAFDLWGDEPSLYDGSNNGYRAIIRRYAQPINEEVARIRFATSTNPTKRIKAVNGATSHESGTTGKQSSGTITTDRAHNDGEFTTETETYPTGYTDAPDKAYLSARAIESPFEQSDHDVTENTANETADSTKETTSSGNADTEETDELARASMLTYTSRLAKLIEGCVFKFLAGTATRGCVWH